MDEQFAKYIGVSITCSVKYIFGVLGALSTGLNFFETLVSTLAGGMVGVFVYLYLWDLIMFSYRKFVPKKPKLGGIKISNTKRWIVKVVIKYELYGIAFLTPLLLSVPIGTLLAAAIEPNKWRIKLFMFFSFLGWTLLLYGIYALFGIRVDKIF
jgi:hypothetical protein